MTEREKEDRWRSLAEELGLPPEPNEPLQPPPPIAAAPAAPPPVYEPPPPPPPRAEFAEIADPSETPLEPASTVPFEQELPPITSLDPPTLDPMLDAAADREAIYEDPQATVETERPRGRGGRRGQRGRRGRSDRDEPRPQAGESRPASEPVEEARNDRGRRGRGGRRPEPEPEPEREELPEMEDEGADLEPAFVAEEEVDEGPEDNLADLNVPSWAELIGSLYRPER